ncbi:Uncharacterised protein [Vibrio cholerae]|nr:Uncharacterised protein [Vibrio cholerae]
MTCLTIGLPANVCSTFGILECIRVPFPAARITVLNFICYLPSHFSASYSKQQTENS